MRYTTEARERSFGYLLSLQLNSRLCYQPTSRYTLVPATSSPKIENLLVVAGKAGQNILESKFNSYHFDNKSDSGKAISIAIDSLRSFDNYTKL
ncbi:MAG: hypothetical protein FD167_4792 [bacterium]|nr:MAG: hypothetical protein FD167_4792 [bacterium]